jgi:hypothetical protein
MGLKVKTVSPTSTAQDIIRATCKFEAERDVSSTETNMAAFRDTDPLKAVEGRKREKRHWNHWAAECYKTVTDGESRER